MRPSAELLSLRRDGDRKVNAQPQRPPQAAAGRGRALGARPRVKGRRVSGGSAALSWISSVCSNKHLHPVPDAAAAVDPQQPDFLS